MLAAYHPALIFPDSVRYLQYAHNFAVGRWSPDALRQSGYSVLIIPIAALHDLWLVPLTQHLAGLATAVLVYAVLIRFGARTWLAALATIPVLFDPLQLVLEQYVLTDVWTVLLIVGALVLLVWRREGPTVRAAAMAGLLLGVAVMFRDQELIMIVPAALYVLLLRGRRLVRLAALTGCFLVPVVGYLGWFDAAHGQFNFTTFDGAFLYGRVADFADCQGLNLPAYERPLCPAEPPAQRIADFYTWDPSSPQWTFTPPAGTVQGRGGARLQPADPAAPAGRLRRSRRPRLRLRVLAGPRGRAGTVLAGLPAVPDEGPAGPAAYASIGTLGYPPPQIRAGPAAFLAAYGRWFYLPGPLFAAGLALALAGLVFGRGDRRALLLFTVSAVAVLLPPAMFATFDWRYQLPQLSLIPVAAVLGADAIRSRFSASLEGKSASLDP